MSQKKIGNALRDRFHRQAIFDDGRDLDLVNKFILFLHQKTSDDQRVHS